MSAGCYRLGVNRIGKACNPDIRNQVALDGSEGAVVRSETYAVIVIQIVRDSRQQQDIIIVDSSGQIKLGEGSSVLRDTVKD